MLPLVIAIGVVTAVVLIVLAIFLLRRLHSLMSAASRLQREVEPSLVALRADADELTALTQRVQATAASGEQARR